jgi:hypothetical protein
MTAGEIASRVRISEVYHAQTGIQPRRTGRHTWRAAAPWRGGDSRDSVSGDDSRGVWHDFVTDQGGGVLDLVVQVRGGSRADALRWVADFAGVALDDKPLLPKDHQRWVTERREFERDLPEARYWRRTAVTLAEEASDREKSRVFDPTEGPADLYAIRNITGMLARLRAMGEVALVAEYHWWRERYPDITWALVQAARRRERAEVQALCRFMGFPECAATAYSRQTGGAA